MIKCEICGAQVHAIETHLRDAHPAFSVAEYRTKFPDAAIFSDLAVQTLHSKGHMLDKFGKQIQASDNMVAPPTLKQAATQVSHQFPQHTLQQRPLHEVFGLGDAADAKNSRGGAIPVTVFKAAPDLTDYLRDIDPDHIWNIEDLKNELIAIELGRPLLCYGHKGTGKTTDLLQIAARTGRPVIRVQHTGNTEEAHVVGQYMVRGGDLHFQLGPLAIAMQRGMMYIADEYDMARPEVIAVYQPIMEGESLIIKEAPPEMRIIRPAPGFAFCATGNTNGTGDATGLYAGTTIQNSANYDRFCVAVEKGYLSEALEASAIVKHTGIAQKEAERLVKLATEVRKLFASGKLSDTLSTRTLINVADIGLRRVNMRLGLRLCFANKLNPTDRAVIDGVAQRHYG